MKAKHLVLLFILCAIIAYFANSDFLVGNALADKWCGKHKWCDKIKIDGKSKDWKCLPTLIRARNNLEEYFPAEVKAAVSDRVDVKRVKAFIDGKKGRFYFFFQFWGGPVWPLIYEREIDGQLYVRHRGYYHLMLDLDNDPSTGWDNRWYEAHYTPLGYYASQGLRNTRHIGAECMIDLELDAYWTPPAQSGEPKYVRYWGGDVHECGGERRGRRLGGGPRSHRSGADSQKKGEESPKERPAWIAHRDVPYPAWPTGERRGRHDRSAFGEPPPLLAAFRRVVESPAAF